MPFVNIEQRRWYQRNWIAKRRAEVFDGKVCLDCFTDKDLELHHLDPTKKVSHKIWSWSRKRRDEELAKCVIVCNKCHDIRQFGPVQHGTLRSYKHHKCRCTECRKANALTQFNWFHKK